MCEINVYDFDKTIYNGDSSLDFYLFCLKRRKRLVFLLPRQILGIIFYKLGIYSKEQMKSDFFYFVKYLDVKEMVKEFWSKNDFKITKWYLKQKEESDLIISASPEFLLAPICEKLNVKLIASLVNATDGKFIGFNCYGKEKLNRLEKQYPNIKIDKFYSDSKSDKYIADISSRAFLVKKQKVGNWDE